MEMLDMKSNRDHFQEMKYEVTLSNTYPRKDFKSDDLVQSLSSLGLTGNVSLVGKSVAAK